MQKYYIIIKNGSVHKRSVTNCTVLLQSLSLKAFDVLVYAAQFIRNTDVLRAISLATAAGNAVVCLADSRYGLVIGQQILAAGACIVFLLLALYVCAGGDVVIVELEYAGYVDAVRAGHAVVAGGTLYQRIILHHSGNVKQHLFLLLIKRLEIKE